MKTLSIFITSVLLAIALCGTAFAEQQDVTRLSGLNFDGTYLSYSYFIESGCRAEQHKTKITVEPADTTRKAVRKLAIRITDTTDESRCGTTRNILVKGQANLRYIVRSSISDLEDGGYSVGDDYSLVLPEVEVSSTTSDAGTTENNSTPVEREPERVLVVRRSYTPQFSCLLRKNDGARKDGFTGTGATLQEALQQSIAGCRTTNHPKCQEFANDTSHTTCNMTPKEIDAVEEYDAGRLPDMTGAKSSWNCLLKQSDTSSTIFAGTGVSEMDARKSAEANCSIGGLDNCDDLSANQDNTRCGQGYLFDSPMPKLLWSCYLRKNDGSKKDGFEGTGASVADAQSNAAKGCYRTNHPQCDAFSKDSTHTACQMKVVY